MEWLKHLQRAPGGATQVHASAVRAAAALARPVDQETLVAGLAVLAKRYGADDHVAFASDAEIVRASLGETYTLDHVRAALDRRPAENVEPGLPSPRLRVCHSTHPPAVAAGSEDLTLWIDAGNRCGAVFDPAVYRRAMVEDLVENLSVLLDGMTGGDGRQRLEDLPLLAADQRERLLAWSYGPQADAPFVGIVARFERAAREHADAVALRAGDERLTYGELDRRADLAAQRLARAGVRRGSRVVVCLPRGTSLVVGLLGILKAGACYVAIDPGYPVERIAFIAADTAATLVLADGSVKARFPEQLRVLRIDEPEAEGVAAEAPPADAAAVGPDDVAYILYTSGSTGMPKGVVVGHDNLDHFLRWSIVAHDLGSGDVAAATTSILFDVSVCDLWTPLVSGATLCLLRKPTELFELRDVRTVALLCAVPSAFHSPFALKRLLADDGAAPAIGTLNLAGEALEPSLASAILHRVRPRSLRNCYGPTEATVYATWTEVRAGDEVTIGRPLANMRAFVVDRHGHWMPPGMPGELALEGAGVARGYLNRDELTKERFVNPGFDRTLRVYRTGDVVRFRDDGQIRFIGRADQQIKLNGYRIELGEIEAAILERTDVAGCAVFPVAVGRRGTVLVACFQAPAGETPASIVRKIAPFLTDYMVPTEWVRVESFPHTPGGKVDRVALRALAEERLRPLPDNQHATHGARS
jgi:amino acid adenylation domain-containing protein